MGTIYFACDCCNESDVQSVVYDREELRLMPAGEWICRNCYEDAPAWTYTTKPSDPIDEHDEPRWCDMPMIPNYIPETSLTSG